MKKLFALTIALCCSVASFAQCTPDPSVTQPGLFPPDSLMPCIITAQPYDTVIQFKNFTTIDPADFGINIGFPITITVNWIQIDTITNLPSGMTYVCDEPDCYYTSGANGCIRVSGTTSDPRGNYKLALTATVSVSIPFFLDTIITINSEDSQGFGAGGFFSYTFQVIEPGDPCPYPMVSVATADSLLCEGATTTLDPLIRFGVAPFTFTWSPATGLSDTTAQNPIVALDNGDVTYTVEVVDANGTEFSTSYNLVVNELPIAGFTYTVNGNVVSFESTSQNTQGVIWNFGDGGTANGPLSQRAYSATEETSFEVTMIAQNDCGNDTTSQLVTVTSVTDKYANDFDLNIYPNPNNGKFSVSMQGAAHSGKTVMLKIFNTQGETVYAENITPSSSSYNQQLNFNSLSKGIYFLHLESENAKSVSKISIIH